MDFIRFYGKVLQEAFRHSLDIAQGAIFLVIILAGSIAAGNPGARMTLESLDLGGWKTAALVFGSIIGARLILAPYWLWKAAQARNVTSSERSVDYKLRVHSFSNRVDRKQNALQIIFMLNNASFFHAIQYEVEDVYVEIEGSTAENPTFANKGEIVSANSQYKFDFPWIFLTAKKKIAPGIQGHASITYKYGIAGQQFTRRARFAAAFVIERNHIRHNSTDDTEENI
jgi:hypothetical protein